MATDLTRPEPGVVLELLEAFRRSKVMFAGVSLGIFDALREGPKSAATLASELRLDADALARLLDACIGLLLLTRDGERYVITPAARAYLTSDSPLRMTGYINYSNDVAWKLWANLEGAIREGTHRWKETFGWDGPIFASFFKTDAAKREFLMGMHGFGCITSPQVAAAFDLSRFRTLVDLGGATGHFAIAACQHYPQLRAIIFDLPDVAPLAREIVGTSSVQDRITFTPGDFFADPLPAGDLFVMGRILHDWTEEKCLTLLKRVFDTLPSGGALLVVEKMLHEDKNGPRWAQMQDLNMLTCTEGRERNLAEYETLLTRAGFQNVTGFRTTVPADGILATKP